jgi:glycosyltransferase involved in cell wall biosynthesis
MTREIVRILNELGFVVDVVNYKDSTFHVKYKYDLFIGHGGINFGAISSQLPVETVRVFFSSMCYWRFNNKEEIARFSELEKRRNIKLPLDRYIEAGEDDALQVADGVIAIGNNFTKKTYQQYASKIYMVNNTTPEDNHYDLSKKDFSVGRDHFLFYAGGGNVHKGLDLLFEAFMDCRDQHLWVCTRIDDVLMEAYAEDLQNHPNIHLVGWVEARSKQFYDLVDLCNWVICPSCSEASCGSIVECLNYGLIPLISDATSIDVGDFGVRINPCNIQEIVRTISRVSTFSPERCQRMSDKARATALQDYSEEKFHRDFKNSLSQILQKCEVLLP